MAKINNMLISNDLFFITDIHEEKTVKETCIDDHSSLDDRYLQQLKKIRSKKKKLIDQPNAGIALTPHYGDPLVFAELNPRGFLIEQPSVKTKSMNVDVVHAAHRDKAANVADVAKRVLILKKESNKSPTTTSTDLINTTAADKPKKVNEAVKQILPMEKPLNKSTEVTPLRVSNRVLDRGNGEKENNLGESRVVRNKKVSVSRINQQPVNLASTHNAKGLPQASYDKRIPSSVASEKNHDLILNVPKKQVESVSREKISHVTGVKFDDSASKLKNNKKEDKNDLVLPMDSKVNVEGHYTSSATTLPTLDRGMIGTAIKHMIECVEKELSAPTITQTSHEDNVMVYHFNQWHGNNSVTFHFDKEKNELLYMEPSNTFVEKQLAANLESFPAKYRAYIRDGDGQEQRQNHHHEEENDEKDNK